MDAAEREIEEAEHRTPPPRPVLPWPAIAPYAYASAWGMLLVFVFFLAGGRSVSMPVAKHLTTGLSWNVGLSLLFFLQHELMARRWVRRHLTWLAPGHHYQTLFTLASALALAPTVFYWSWCEPILYDLRGLAAWVLRVVTAAALIGIAYAWRFRPRDFPLPGRGLEASSDSNEPPPLITNGPYQWVRHPQHALLLLAFWATPLLTADRLLFNALWSSWVVVGALLADRDLVTTYGDEYRNYQRRVPMLIPGLRTTLGTNSTRP